ncbi:hypothetical protein [Dyella acidiphila]|uniref:Uncharacterized protein n=1 Tax=Dyella acidiphila TaxID=2775866 RepID=A0ABR9GFR1_9GAMM|nr:hypothetical protein [Dyella acidiphila]MBE1162886.1 hypothetical protein [Dyella acidiphila]
MEPNFSDLKFNKNQKSDLTAREISKGQKAIIYAFLINLVAIVPVVVLPSLNVSHNVGGYIILATWIVRLGTIALGLYGIFKIASELGWSDLAKLATFVLLLIPVINLIALLVVNGRATAFLKKAGYKVGLAGAYK